MYNESTSRICKINLLIRICTINLLMWICTASLLMWLLAHVDKYNLRRPTNVDMYIYSTNTDIVYVNENYNRLHFNSELSQIAGELDNVYHSTLS